MFGKRLDHDSNLLADCGITLSGFFFDSLSAAASTAAPSLLVSAACASTAHLPSSLHPITHAPPHSHTIPSSAAAKSWFILSCDNSCACAYSRRVCERTKRHLPQQRQRHPKALNINVPLGVAIKHLHATVNIALAHAGCAPSMLSASPHLTGQQTGSSTHH